MVGSSVPSVYHELQFPTNYDRLKTAFASNGIISVMHLSTSELKALHFSHLQLFSSNKIDQALPSLILPDLIDCTNSSMDTDHQTDRSSSPSSKATSPPSAFSFPTLISDNHDHPHELLQIHEKSADACTFDSPDSFAFFPDTIEDIKTEKMMHPLDFCSAVFKSKADVVLEAEKAFAENFSKKISLSVVGRAAASKKKAMSMDEMSFQACVLSLSPKNHSDLDRITRDDCIVHHQSKRDRSEEAVADLKVSPAAKFLLLMPRDISPWAATAPFKNESTLSEDHTDHHHHPSYSSHIKHRRQNYLSGRSECPQGAANSDTDTVTATQPQNSYVSQSEDASTMDDRNDHWTEGKASYSSPAAAMPSDFVLKSVAAIAVADSAPACVSMRQHLSSENSLSSRLTRQMRPDLHDQYPQRQKTVRSMVSVWLDRCSAKRMRKLQQKASLWASTLSAYYKSIHRQPSSASIAQMPQRPQLEDHKKKWRRYSPQQKSSRTDQNRDLHAYVSGKSSEQLNLPSMKLWIWQLRPRKWAKRPRKWIMRRIRTSYSVLVATYKAIRKAIYWRKQRQWQLKSSIHSKTPYQSLHHQPKPSKPQHFNMTTAQGISRIL